jgi:hypothetical protein
MLTAMNNEVEKHFPRKEHVLLRFNKRDSQITRNWSKSTPAKDVFDEKN